MHNLPKITVSFCIHLWMLSCSVVIASTPLQLNDQEHAWIKANPLVTVANEMDWPPFDYMDQGKPAGYSIDIVRLIKQKTGLQIKFINGLTWQELFDQFRSGKIDIMPAIYLTQQRQQYALFTRSYYSQPSVMVVHENTQDISGIDSLAGKRVAGINAFAITRTLQKNVPDIKIIPVNNIIEGLKAVSLGEADAFIDSIGTISYHLEHNYIPNLKIIGKFDNDFLGNPSLHFGVHKNKIILRNILDKALASISKEEKKTLEKRWIRIPESINKQDISQKIVLTPEQQEWIAEHPVIRIGFDAGYAPYSFLDKDGTFIGVAPDYVTLLSEKLGITFEAIPDISWPQILKGARDHSIDVIATAVATDERRSFLNFTQKYIPTPLVIMSRINDDRIKNVSDLDKMTVALVTGYSSSKRIIKEHPTIKTHMVITPTEGLHAVSSGNADAYIGVVGINIYQAQKQGITNLKIAGNYDVVSNGQRFAVRSDWTTLTQILERAIDSINEEQRKAIYDKWINVPYVEQTDYTLLWNTIAAFLIIVCLMYLYNRRLSKEINRWQTAEHNLHHLNEELIIARDGANKANQAKSEFLSNMSHELRTPLHAILGFSQLLETEFENKRHKECIHDIHTAGEDLLELIDEVLDLSRIEVDKLKLHSSQFNLTQVINECLSKISAHAEKRNVQIINNMNAASDIILNVDYIRLKQIIHNLLSNAVKYNKENGQLTLDISQSAKNYLHITISDTGKGLTDEEQSRLFQPFERIGAENTSVKGAGIGLAISKQLIEKMGGSIGVKSLPGHGTSFWIDIPLSN